MPPTLPTLARDLLATLLDRYERPGRQTVVRVTLDSNKHAAYFDNHETRAAVEAALAALADEGVIVIQRVRYQAHLIDKIDLVPGQAGALYARLRRTPLAEAETAVRQLLEAQVPQAEWQARFLAHCLAQMAAHKSIAPLRLGEDAYNRELLRALEALAGLTEPVLERVFSARALGDSKRFADLRGDLLAILRKFSPQAAALGHDDPALLAAHFLERVPEYVQLAGALTLQVEAGLCDCAPFVPSLAVPASLLRPAGIAACGASQVLTIENATAFESFCRVRPAGVLAVFTGGFASPTVILLLQRLRQRQPELGIGHWGDLDAGGLRILRHLRHHLGGVRPILMDAATLAAHAAHAQPLQPTERTALEALAGEPLLEDCQPLITALLAANRKLEQEAVSEALVLRALPA